MSLHVEIHGRGEPLLLIHGWGMHGGVWDGIVPQLAEHFEVRVVDLPGHGRSREAQATDGLDDLVEQLAAQFAEPMAVCGWSLGGQIALHWAAHHPQQVRKLVLIASTPCFAEREDWFFGMEAATLAQFATELEKNYAATLRRFLSLQVRGSENERELLAALRSSLFSHGEPDVASLRNGLAILRDADLREELPGISQPTLVITGERDKLTPPEASYYLAQTLSDVRLEDIQGAAHAPFLSHTGQVIESMLRFLRGPAYTKE